MRIKLFHLVAMIALGYLAGPVMAADWKVGLARVDITPTESIYLAGHATKNRFSTGALHPIWIKAMVIEGTEGGKVAIISADIFGMQRAQTDAVWDMIEARTGLGRERVAINFSHCHALPLLAGVLPPAYKALVEPPEHWEVINRYTQRVQESMVQAVVEAMAAMQPATLAYGEDSCDIREKDRDIKPYTDEINKDRPFNDRVPVIRISNPQGKIIGILFGYPTHAQSAGNLIHGGYMGYACVALEEKHPGAQAMFLLGTGALTTIRGIHHAVFRHEASEDAGMLLFEAVERALAGSMTPLPAGRVAAAAGDVELLFQSPANRQAIRRVRYTGVRGEFPARAYEFQLAYEEEQGRPLASYDAIQQVLRLGDDLTLVFMSGEVAEGYGYRISELEYPDRRVWVNAFSNDLFAYVPTEGVLAGPRSRVGGASQQFWGWPSRWASGIEDRIVAKVRQLVAEVDAP